MVDRQLFLCDVRILLIPGKGLFISYDCCHLVARQMRVVYNESLTHWGNSTCVIFRYCKTTVALLFNGNINVIAKYFLQWFSYCKWCLHFVFIFFRAATVTHRRTKASTTSLGVFQRPRTVCTFGFLYLKYVYVMWLLGRKLMPNEPVIHPIDAHIRHQGAILLTNLFLKRLN